MTQVLEQCTYTREEYLEFETASEERHEYVNGEIRLMTGGTPDHNELAINLATLLKSALRGKPYRVFDLTSGCGFPVAEPPQRGIAIFTPIPI